MFKIKISFAASGAVNRLLHEVYILRMNAPEHEFQRRFCLRVNSHNAEGFRRPNEFSRSDPPTETAGTTQVLCFRQIGSATAQGLVRLGAFNRDAGEMRELFDDTVLVRCGTRGLAAIERERSQHLAFGGEDRYGPARAQSFLQREITVIGP